MMIRDSGYFLGHPVNALLSVDRTLKARE